MYVLNAWSILAHALKADPQIEVYMPLVKVTPQVLSRKESDCNPPGS